MKWWATLVSVLLLVWLATGFSIVPGNEKAVVRRFGRIVTAPVGRPALLGSGIHYDLPWPLAQLDRFNLNEVRSLAVGEVNLPASERDQFLSSDNSTARSQYLTGDKNILQVQIGIQYRISETDFADYLYASSSPEEHLQRLAEATAADLIARSGVDYVHPLGLGELRRKLTERVRQLAAEQRLGLEIEEVAVSAVAPPVHVKADFLEVSNARADKEKYVNSALAYSEQRREAARAEAQAILDEAAIYRQQTVEAAKGSANRFTSLVAQFRRHESDGGSYAAARQMALRREYLTTMQNILRNVAGKVLLDSGKPVDLTIVRDPQE